MLVLEDSHLDRNPISGGKWHSRWKEDGAPGRIRTSDPLIRSQILYPAELRAHAYALHLRCDDDTATNRS